MKFAPALLIPFVLAACARSTEPDPTPADDGGIPYNMVDPVPSPLPPANSSTAAGMWRSETVRGRPALLFASVGGGEPIAALYCDERRGLVVERRGLVPTGAIGMMALSAGDERQELAVVPAEEQGKPVLRASIPFNATLITALQRTPQPLTMRVGEGETISLPGTPLLPQLIDTCRSNG